MATAESKRQSRAVFKRMSTLGLALIFAVGLAYIVASSTPQQDENTPVLNRVAMSCPQVMEHVGDYFAGELSNDQRQLVHAHLQKCKYCRKHYQDEADSRGMELLLTSVAPAPVVTVRLISLCMANTNF